MTTLRLALLSLLVTAACTDGAGPDTPSPDAPGATLDARHDTDAAPAGADAAVDAAPPIDAPSVEPAMFPISGPTESSPVIASVTLSCHAMYSPRIIRVRVAVTDAQGAGDRGTGSGVLELPDGTAVAVDLPEPYDSSPYEEWVRFGTGQNLTLAQFDAACAAQLLALDLVIADKTGHVTTANDLGIAPTVGGTL